MTDKEFLIEFIKRGSKAQDGYFQYAHIAAGLVDKRLLGQLRQLVNGPVWDGNVMSKSYRDELIELGLATRVCAAGEQGYTAATYFAYSILEASANIESGRVAP